MVIALPYSAFYRLAYYRANPQSFSRKLFQQIRQNFEGHRLGTQSPWLIPTFVPGKSVAPPQRFV